MVIIWDEILDEMYLSVFHSVSNRAYRSAPETVSPSRLGMLSTVFFSKSKRLYNIHVT